MNLIDLWHELLRERGFTPEMIEVTDIFGEELAPADARIMREEQSPEMIDKLRPHMQTQVDLLVLNLHLPR